MTDVSTSQSVHLSDVSEWDSQENSNSQISSCTDSQTSACSGSSQDTTKTTSPLTKEQRERIERNRQRALLIREARQANKRAADQPDSQSKNTASSEKQSRIGPQKLIDTGGGFLLEEEEVVEVTSSRPKIVHPPAALIDKSRLTCDDCTREFSDSYLFSKFSHAVCDDCKDTEDKHRMITRTDAKEKYLLKDADLDVREPVLPFVVKKNPHNPRWGDMKLYLECQVAELAGRVWGSDEALDDMKEKRQANREQLKKKRFDKKVKELRIAVRGSMYRKATAGHEHEFGEEQYNEEEDTYSKTCSTCGHVTTYEKM